MRQRPNTTITTTARTTISDRNSCRHGARRYRCQWPGPHLPNVIFHTFVQPLALLIPARLARTSAPVPAPAHKAPCLALNTDPTRAPESLSPGKAEYEPPPRVAPDNDNAPREYATAAPSPRPPPPPAPRPRDDLFDDDGGRGDGAPPRRPSVTSGPPQTGQQGGQLIPSQAGNALGILRLNRVLPSTPTPAIPPPGDALCSCAAPPISPDSTRTARSSHPSCTGDVPRSSTTKRDRT